ncbi:RelA/SpoT domain-containing protein [Geothrix mesophila]|uniref:RelA/SpoT domain-containing protein n=1 Tax=Geothrix mesophila TaxID=2922723 RepID=UPI001FAB8F70|nr:RelA/SpoT domain-containing protein [Geothrix sp. SG198]
MAYAKLEFSKGEITRAGNILRDPSSRREDLWWALTVLSNFRAAHYYPINTFQATLRQKLKSIDSSALVARRLKRTPSIVAKLERESGMDLLRMQDIGGLRAVVKTLKQVRALYDNYKQTNFLHKLSGEKDYINSPKISGYRSVHLIYRYYKNDIIDYNGLRLELQIRTKVQHAWATAVETLGTFIDHSLKSSEGPEEWLSFFSLAGSAFAHLEGCNPVPGYEQLSAIDTYKLTAKRAIELSVFDQLTTFSSAVNTLSNTKLKGSYYLLVLDPKNKTVFYRPYSKERLQEATEDYLTEEKKAIEGSKTQVVLVAADSITSLKRAYPNYFLDTHEFLNLITRVSSIASK